MPIRPSSLLVHSMALAVTLVAAFVVAPRALAFVPSGFTWRSLPLRYEVNTASSREIGRDGTLAAVAASYVSWEEPLCSGFTAMLAGETTAPHNASDGRNTLVWMYDAATRPPELGGASTLGIALSLYSEGAAIDCDILLNGIDHHWTTTPDPGFGDVDAQSIVTHETGHQLGLAHSPLVSATMYGSYSGGTGDRSLAADDIDGVCALYPSGATPECTRDLECGADRVCRGGACVAIPPEMMRMLGDPCASPDECPASYLCVDFEGDTFCTSRCAADCPVEWTCEPVTLSGMPANICLPEGAPTGTGVFASPCDDGSVCSSGLCVDVGDGIGGLCSLPCVDDAVCPTGAECAALVGGGGACVPAPPEADAGPPDAGPDDAGVEPDLGVEDAAIDDASIDDAASDDAGGEPEDAGDEPVDLGRRDAGTARDAGSMRRDAAPRPIDASADADAVNPVAPDDGGCGCVTAGARTSSRAPWLAIGALAIACAVFSARRARRRPRR